MSGNNLIRSECELLRIPTQIVNGDDSPLELVCKTFFQQFGLNLLFVLEHSWIFIPPNIHTFDYPPKKYGGQHKGGHLFQDEREFECVGQQIDEILNIVLIFEFTSVREN
ncbi:hypothetical protein BLNAU_7172 [Blattamonas nauphoetae]|uniref:Uncharacterized protein n=1 Tax=Blattamonas nauphoetae TaxID=2049346 RepID=A0ABQ9Y1W9_9EUKA|nr:hypothetical protein BLNAU_7172 [Blattamonas nauphoetae]